MEVFSIQKWCYPKITLKSPQNYPNNLMMRQFKIICNIININIWIFGDLRRKILGIENENIMHIVFCQFQMGNYGKSIDFIGDHLPDRLCLLLRLRDGHRHPLPLLPTGRPYLLLIPCVIMASGCQQIICGFQIFQNCPKFGPLATFCST